MIRFLIRHDPLRWSAAGMWLVGVLYGVVMARAGNEDFALGYGPHTQPADKTFLEYAFVQMTTFAIVSFASLQAWRVASPFQRTLPLSARDLFWSRMLVTLGGLLGASLLACVCFTLTWAHELHPLQVALAVNAHGLLVLIPVLYHAGRVRRAQGLPWFVYAPLLVGLVWTGVQLGMRTWWPGVFWLGLSAALAVSIHRRLPPAYELASSRGRALLGGWAAVEDRLARVPLLGPVLTFDRCLRGPQAFTRTQLMLVLCGTALLGSLLLADAGWAALLALVLAQLAWFARCVGGGGRVAHLPLPRGRVFWHAVLPGLALVALAALADPLFDNERGWHLLGTPLPTRLVWDAPAWPAVLVLWAACWLQLLSLLTVSGPLRERPTRVVAAVGFLLVAMGSTWREAQRDWIAAHVDLLPPSVLWPAAALAWLGAVLLLRAAFLRADCAPSPPEALT